VAGVPGACCGRSVLREFQPPEVDPARVEALDAFIQRRMEAGGAPPES